jgi:hypothetical protein
MVLSVSLPRTVLLLSLLSAPAAAQIIFHPEPPAPREFPIMAWGTAPSDPEQLRWMKEAGLNVAGFTTVGEIGRVRQAGLACFVRDPRAGGYDWEHLPAESEIRARVRELAREIGDNPAVLGFYLRDEPHAALMPGLAKVAAILREEMPGKWPYVNLFPSRVSTERVGVATYDEYVKLLVDTIKQPFISYDNYSLVGGEMLDSFWENLEIIRRISLEKKVPFWNCILANAHFNYMEPSDATFALQVYATLAYGGRGIQYFTYYSPQIGNYRLGAIDQFGDRTPTWHMLRRINKQLHALAPTVVKLRSTGVYHHPEPPPSARPLAESRLVERVEMAQRYVTPPVAGRFLVGEFEDGQGRPYLMLVNKDLRHSFRFTIHLKQPGRKLIHISPYSGKEEPFGREMDWLAPGAGTLFRIE